MDANIMDAYEILKSYLENSPEIKKEIEAIVIMAKLDGYSVSVSAHITDHEDAFFMNFWLNSQERVQLDLVFNNNAKLRKVCTCNGEEQSRCNEIDFESPQDALSRIKSLL